MKIRDTGRIQGEGFYLRPIIERDAPLMVAASFSDIPDWTFIPRNLDPDAAETWIQRGLTARKEGRAVRFVIEHTEGQAGTVGAEHPYTHDLGIVEVFYFIFPEFRRRGLATASLRVASDWVRRVTPELRRLQLHVIVGNPGSGRVAKLAGYKYEGIATNQIPATNGFGVRDAEVYGIGVSNSSQSEVVGVLA
jgi:RimJ/RimL family protein N-acetyltransferase